MKNLSDVKKAPLYRLIGKVGVNSDPRIFPLTKAFKNGGNWSYPGKNGNCLVPFKMIGEVEKDRNASGERVITVYCEFRGLKSAVLAIETHNKKNFVCKVVAKTEAERSYLIKSTKSKALAKIIIDNHIEKHFKKDNSNTAKKHHVVSTGKVFTGKDLEDYDAVMDILNGNKNEFAILYKRYYNIIMYKYCKNLNFKDNELAEDLAMELFGRVYEKLHTYTPTFTFSTWITNVAKNFFIDYTRKQKENIISMDAPIKGGDDDSGEVSLSSLLKDEKSLTPYEVLVNTERKEALILALNKLDGLSKRIVIARYLYKKSCVEIMAEEKISESMVKTTLFRSKARLKVIFEKNAKLLHTV